MLHDHQKSAALGAVMGALAGDAAGATLEFLGRKPDEDEVHHAMQMPGGGCWSVAPGQITDDGELTLALIHALAGEKSYDPRRVASSYRSWFLSSPFDVGCATSAALGYGAPYSADLHKTIQHNARQHNAGSKANGSLMRASGLGVWSVNVDFDQAVSAALNDAQMTHPNPSCQWAGAAYVVAIRHLVLNPGDAAGALNQVDLLLRQQAAASEVLAWFQDARSGDLPDCYPLAGFIRIAFTHTFYHLHERTAYPQAIFSTLAGGGDTDTNACIVGGLIGALHGASSIPALMKNAVMQCDTSQGRQRPDWLSGAQVEELVKKLIPLHSDSAQTP